MNKLPVNQMYYPPLYNLLIHLKQPEYPLGKHLADTVLQMLKVYRLLHFLNSFFFITINLLNLTF